MKEVYIRFGSGNVDRIEIEDDHLEKLILRVDEKKLFIVGKQLFNAALIERIWWRSDEDK